MLQHLDRLVRSVSFVALSALLTACAVTPEDPESLGSNDEAIVQKEPWHSQADVANAAEYAKVLSFFRKSAVRGSFESHIPKSHDTRQGPKVEIAYAIVRAENEKGAIVLLNGRTESFEHYAELAWDLTRRGYTLYMMDHRGQGYSSRLLDYDRVGDSSYQKGHVEAFRDYVVDVQTFITTVVQPDRAGKSPDTLYGLGHSMGGTVLTIFAERHPKALAKIALSSPMLALDIDGGFGLWLATWLHPTSYVDGKGPRDGSEHFAGNKLTSSRPRFMAKQDVWADHPKVSVGGPTYDWLDAARNAMSHARDDAALIEIPVLLLRAGNDRVVEPGGQAVVCNAINTKRPGGCRLEVLRDAEHESLIEVDAIRGHALDSIVKFLEE